MQTRAAAIVVLGAALMSAQERTSSVQETKHLTVQTSIGPAAGKRVTLAVEVTPKPKMHVYSPGQSGYMAVALTLDANPAFTAARAKYPAGAKMYLPVLKETQLVYATPFRIAQEITRVQASSSPLTIKGTLRYQACDDTICYLPVTVPVSWTLK